jgi:predicted SnoaL-like aldol condensation-catalyzing enzyme
MAQDLDVNKSNAQNFYLYSFYGYASVAVAYFVGSTFKIDNEAFGTTKESFIAYFDYLHSNYAGKTYEIDRIIASKDLVTFQTTQTWPNGKTYRTMNFFKFNNDAKIIAYWDKRTEIAA